MNEHPKNERQLARTRPGRETAKEQNEQRSNAETAAEQAGMHPVGTALGAIGGAGVGAVAGIAAGPVGSLAGAAAGAVLGGMAGSSPSAETATGPVAEKDAAPPDKTNDPAARPSPPGNADHTTDRSARNSNKPRS